MKIITWNVNGIRAVAKKGFADFVASAQPDILCVQETKAHPEQVDPEIFKGSLGASYWSAAYRPGYSGTATFSRQVPVSVARGFGVRKFDTEGRMVVTDHGEFLLYNVYFPNGGSGEERHLFKQEFLRKLARHLVKVVKGGREVVVVGDYNVAHADIDVYNPELLAGESGFLREERAWMTAFLADGFVDLFRAFHPEAKNRFTWWNQIEKARPSNKGWRIDYICASVKLAKRFTSCDILDSVQGSDHCPVVAEFK